MVTRKNLALWCFCFITSLVIGNAQVVISSEYKPLSYSQMLGPVIATQNFHNRCCETLMSLINDAEQIESYISKKDSITWRRYVNYYNSCVDEYNDIMAHGVNLQTFYNINTLKINFPKVINGIFNAYKRRNELASRQYQYLQHRQNCRVDRFFSDISLDEFLDGKTPNVNYFYNE